VSFIIFHPYSLLLLALLTTIPTRQASHHLPIQRILLIFLRRATPHANFPLKRRTSSCRRTNIHFLNINIHILISLIDLQLPAIIFIVIIAFSIIAKISKVNDAVV
jgi:hypothetical protein